MNSLRARVLTSVLVLAACGMVALAAVTYAEQHSFLLGRLDQQVRAGGPAMSQLLDSKGLLPAGAAHNGSNNSLNPDGAHDRHGPPNVSLPPGTFGQRRDASGKVLGSERFSYGQRAPAEPKIPAKIPVGKLFTVGSTGSSGLRYRVYATQDPEDTGVTIVAAPLSDVDQTLHRLLLVEALVIAGVLGALGVSAFFVVKLGLRPLDRIERDCRPDRRRDDVPPRQPRHRKDGGGPPRTRPQRDARPARAGLRRPGPPAKNACASSSPTPRTSCARRWPRSAATRSCFAWVRHGTLVRRRTRCGASRRSQSEWGCWSRTC